MDPLQHDWHPYTKRKYRQGYELRKEHVRTQEKLVTYQSRREASEEANLVNI